MSEFGINESASWSNKPTLSTRCKIVSVDGNIGSGKSTLLANLRSAFGNYPNIIFLKEPVDDWEQIKDAEGKTMLEKFYADQERYSFSFQMMAYISRLALLKSAIKQNPGAIIVTERSLYTDKFVFAKMLYDTGKIEDVNYQIYSKWFDTFADECPIHQVIYVNTNPEICHNRITKRSRTGEDSIPLDYLQLCHTYHDDMIYKFLPNENICNNQLTLDGNVDIFENEGHLKSWIEQISRFIGLE